MQQLHHYHTAKILTDDQKNVRIHSKLLLGITSLKLSSDKCFHFMNFFIGIKIFLYIVTGLQSMMQAVTSQQ